jgi:multiple sugar transport system substrate-binding protein
MGTWYVASLIAQRASGDADTFKWGFAPAPQFDASTAGLDKTPVTFGDPTGFGINAAITDDKVIAAKKFLEYAAGEEAASALAGIGITPALTNDTVTAAYFAVDGVPGDDLSKFAWSTHLTKPENPTSGDTAAVQNILNTAIHDPVLADATSIADAIAAAKEQVMAELG